MSTHDPRRHVEALRDHLAAHDKALVFLFGAGTTASINIAPMPVPGTKRAYEPLVPPVSILTDICRIAVRAKGNTFDGAWSAVEMECRDAEQAPDIENVLSRVRAKLDALGTSDQSLGLQKTDLAALEETIRKAIARAVSPKESKIPAHTPHDLFARWAQRIARARAVEVFTTNYDTVLERALETARKLVFDGFVGSR